MNMKWIIRTLSAFALVAGLASSGNCLAAGKLDLNQAGMQQLEQVKGIGPVRAREIIQYRKAHHGFQSVADLEKVKGIGAKTVARLQGKLTVGTTADHKKD